MQITVKLRSDLADALQSPDGQAPQVSALANLLRTVAPTFKAIHPGALDENLGRWFTVDADASDLDSVLSVLRASEGVEAAYVKPDAEAP